MKKRTLSINNQILCFISKSINNNLTIFIFCILISILFLLICTKTSPLYIFNDWVDANASFTMGKSMMNGRVLYKDIFNQKGALVYTIHGLSYLISEKTFIGVFIFEVFFFSIFLFFSFKIARLFLEKKYAFLAIPIISFIILNSINFTHGDSPEEFSITFLMIGLFYLLKYLKTNSTGPIDKRIVLLNGFFAGCVLWMKYSLLGFWFGWILVIIYYSIINRKYLDSILVGFVFLVGMLLATLPFIIYFGVNDGIQDWFEVYFFVNINKYALNSSFWDIIILIKRKIGGAMIRSLPFGFITVFGLYILAFSNYFLKDNLKKISIIIPFIFLVMGVYGGGRGYKYYFIIILPISIFGIIAFINLLKKSQLGKYYNKNIAIYVVMSVSAILFTYTLFFHHNTYMLKLKKKDFVQYSFNEIICKTKNPTLLNYGVLDIGLYTTTGITPNIKYFQKQNISYKEYPINMDEQNRYLDEKLVDFVVTAEYSHKLNPPKDSSFFHDNYYLVSEGEQIYESVNLTFKLYKVK